MQQLFRSRAGVASSPGPGVPRFRWWVVLPLAIAALMAIQGLAWVLFAPWAVTWLPGPKLIGTYAGVVEAEQGARYPLLSSSSRGPTGGSARVKGVGIWELGSGVDQPAPSNVP